GADQAGHANIASPAAQRGLTKSGSIGANRSVAGGPTCTPLYGGLWGQRLSVITIDTDEPRTMTPSYPSNSSQQGLLEEVLEDYMQRLDRGEAVDREQLLARHPELTDELRSYFAGSDEVERLARPAQREPPVSSPFPALPETPSLEGTPSANSEAR